MGNGILKLLRLSPSAQSVDYVRRKKQFQLHRLLTEQRHPKTWDLSFKIKSDALEGLRKILSVDEEISNKIMVLSKKPKLVIQAVNAVAKAIVEGKKIYIYGCGSTGRLAKQIESALWKPFWRQLKSSMLWEKLKNFLPSDIEEHLIGEMTGGDRALVSALEGLEDLQLIGYLQLIDKNIKKGDVLFAITEGGETSSVIGFIQGALKLYGKITSQKKNEIKKKLYFIYNNPNEVLKLIKRSRIVLENKIITKINLTTGPQAIAGSTRAQATTIDTYVMGIIIEEAIYKVLRVFLTKDELSLVGFRNRTLSQRLKDFVHIPTTIFNLINDIAPFTELETKTYKNHHFSIYFAKKALFPIFIDVAERSPTFKLNPLDTVKVPRKSWVRVWTPVTDYREAWKVLLERRFKGLNPPFYKAHVSKKVRDKFLQHTALNSLNEVGQDQEALYDFSFSKYNIEKHPPRKGDLGVMICVDEEIDELLNPSSSFRSFLSLCKKNGSNVALLLITEKQRDELLVLLRSNIGDLDQDDHIIVLTMSRKDDPLNLRRHIALKMVLNAHSTAVMAKLSRVLGNTMVNVNPTNLKLIGRSTFLILSHVNDIVSRNEWKNKYGKTKPIKYADANAILFSAMRFVRKLEKTGQTPEVPLCIFRVLETLRQKKCISWEETFFILENEGFENYLQRVLSS
ncbi:N-acetylmuramic acid 6-phosphate etherase [subsurface metagenome]